MKFKKAPLMVYIFLMMILYFFIRDIIKGLWHLLILNYLFVGCCVVLGYWVSAKKRPNTITAFRMIIAWMPGLIIEEVNKWILKYRE
jgi:hypothetical protein